MEDSFDKTYFISHNLGNVVFELVSRKAFLLFFEDFNCIFGPRKHLKDTGVEALKRSALSAGVYTGELWLLLPNQTGTIHNI